MSTEADDKKFWYENAAAFCELMKLRPLTPEEAEREAKSAPAVPMSEDELQRLIAAAAPCGPEDTCETAQNEEPDFEWLDDVDTAAINDDVLQLNRNKGEDDAEAVEIEEELRRRMLDDEEDEDGMEGGAGPTRSGGRGG